MPVRQKPAVPYLGFFFHALYKKEWAGHLPTHHPDGMWKSQRKTGLAVLNMVILDWNIFIFALDNAMRTVLHVYNGGQWKQHDWETGFRNVMGVRNAQGSLQNTIAMWVGKINDRLAEWFSEMMKVEDIRGLLNPALGKRHSVCANSESMRRCLLVAQVCGMLRWVIPEAAHPLMETDKWK